MKNFIFILFLLPIIGFAQNEFDASLAQVNKVSGKYIFLNCEPVNEYEVVYEVKAFALSFAPSNSSSCLGSQVHLSSFPF